MHFIGWIIFGIIAGFIASKIVNKQGEGIVVDCILGIVGSIVGGFLYSTVFGHGVNDGNTNSLVVSMIVAVVGAIIVLMIYHAVTGRRATY